MGTVAGIRPCAHVSDSQTHQSPQIARLARQSEERQETSVPATRMAGVALIGSVTATEVTGGGTHGWHPHFHTLMLIEATTEAEAIELVELARPVAGLSKGFRPRWSRGGFRCSRRCKRWKLCRQVGSRRGAGPRRQEERTPWADAFSTAP